MSAGPSEPPSVAAAKVFITYRREETAAHAGRLYDAMVARYGEGNVFMDVDLAPGVDFVERITAAVAACHVLIVVMGPRWATVENEQGTPRIADPEDFVRLEVETALRRPDVTPIPVLVSGARMPNRENLPPEVRAITRRNALELSEQRWRYDVGRLISTLDELLARSPLVAAAPALERSVVPGEAAPVNAAQAPAETAPPSPVAATASVESKPAAPPASRVRRPRRALLGAIAIAVIVLAVVLAIDPFGSSVPEGEFREVGLSRLVLEEPPEGLLTKESDTGYAERASDGLSGSSAKPEGAYHKTFTEENGGATLYDYSEATAAVFKDANAAQVALDDLRRTWQGRSITREDLEDLGDDGAGFLVTAPLPEYIYAWRTGALLQVFDLVWNGGRASDVTARRFAEKMDARIPPLP